MSLSFPVLRSAVLAVCVGLVPAVSSAALPPVGTIIGPSPEELSAVMADSGCPLEKMAVENGNVAATCRDTEGVAWSFHIDPTTGRVMKVARIN